MEKTKIDAELIEKIVRGCYCSVCAIDINAVEVMIGVDNHKSNYWGCYGCMNNVCDDCVSNTCIFENEFYCRACAKNEEHYGETEDGVYYYEEEVKNEHAPKSEDENEEEECETCEYCITIRQNPSGCYDPPPVEKNGVLVCYWCNDEEEVKNEHADCE